MIASIKSLARAAAFFAAFFAATIATTTPSAANEATGVWFDHTGRGAVEITDCGGALCGRIVWLKDAANNKTCGSQVIGNVKAVGVGKWDKGWIYDPEDDARYSVEITTVGGDRLKVMGYLGSKMLSETMTWRRAPADIKRCNA